MYTLTTYLHVWRSGEKTWNPKNPAQGIPKLQRGANSSVFTVAKIRTDWHPSYHRCHVYMKHLASVHADLLDTSIWYKLTAMVWMIEDLSQNLGIPSSGCTGYLYKTCRCWSSYHSNPSESSWSECGIVWSIRGSGSVCPFSLFTLKKPRSQWRSRFCDSE